MAYDIFPRAKRRTSKTVCSLFDQDDWRYASGGCPPRAQETGEKAEAAKSALFVSRSMVTALAAYPQSTRQQSRALARALLVRQGNSYTRPDRVTYTRHILKFLNLHLQIQKLLQMEKEMDIVMRDVLSIPKASSAIFPWNKNYR